MAMDGIAGYKQNRPPTGCLLTKGWRKVRVVSPEGAHFTIEGTCLHVARECVSDRHFTIHEQDHPTGDGPVMVAIIPETWAIEGILNQ